MSKRENRNEFKVPNIILCEGADATYFMIKYLEYLRKRENGFEPFMAVDFHGNDNLKNFLADIKLYTGYEQVTSMLILRDAELCFDSAVQAVKSALSNNDYPVPVSPNDIISNGAISVAFSLFPKLCKEGSSGTLENLIIDNLNEADVDKILDDVDAFLASLQAKDRHFTWLHKSKLYTYFSVTDDYVTKKLSEAAEAGAFNFECEEMNSLKSLLLNIARS